MTRTNYCASCCLCICTVCILYVSEVNSETLNILKYVRPGGGFVPKFPVFGKVEVNGSDEEPLFTHLKVTSGLFIGSCVLRGNNALYVDSRVYLISTGTFALCQPGHWRHEEVLLVTNLSQ